MIDRLKKRFVVIGTISVALLVSLLLGVISILNYQTIINDTDEIIDVLAQPNIPFFKEPKPNDIDRPRMQQFLAPNMSLEVPYESRFFIVSVSKDGEILEKDLERIVTIDAENINEYVDYVMNKTDDKGFIEKLRYHKLVNEDNTRIIFLDCGRKIEAFNKQLLISITIGIVGCLISFLVFINVSGKVVKPIAESYNKQKRFIADAGHEMKTPLTIIKANVELLESEFGDSESLNDIHSQVDKLKELTNDLVYLSKMDDKERKDLEIDFPLSDLVEETFDSFKTLMDSKKINSNKDIESLITYYGSPNNIKQLVSILVDNAVKYVEENGNITIALKKEYKYIDLSIQNTYKEKLSKDELNNIFDRFYRTDASRNSETGGHGIGLSIAKAIVDFYKGRISASSDGEKFKINVKLPL